MPEINILYLISYYYYYCYYIKLYTVAHNYFYLYNVTCDLDMYISYMVDVHRILQCIIVPECASICRNIIVGNEL